MKIAQLRNDNFQLVNKPPRRAKLHFSMWAIIDGETQRDSVTTKGKVDVVDFVSSSTTELFNAFLDDLGVGDGDAVDSIGYELYRWR